MNQLSAVDVIMSGVRSTMERRWAEEAAEQVAVAEAMNEWDMNNHDEDEAVEALMKEFPLKSFTEALENPDTFEFDEKYNRPY